MRKLRNRTRADIMENELRKSKRKLGRLIYTLFLAMFVAVITYYFWGHYVLLKASGVVQRDYINIDARFPNIVTRVYVKPGDEVQVNDPIFEVVALPESEFGQNNQALNIALTFNSNSEGLSSKQSITANDAGKIFAPELDGINSQVVYADINGIVSDEIASVGEVFNFGENMGRIYGGETYILAYIPEEYIFDIKLNQPVSIRYAGKKYQGEVGKILPISGSLPPEFQTAIKAQGRNEVIKIFLKEEINVPLLQQVKVRLNF